MTVEKTVDGDDPDSVFTDDETTSVDSTVTYKVVINNDSEVPLIIVSLEDDVYLDAVCRDADGKDILGQTLEADGGGDEVTCTFDEQAPSTPDTVVADTVTVKAQEVSSSSPLVHGPAAQQQPVIVASDGATIRTAPLTVAGPTETAIPTPTAVLPDILPPTGAAEGASGGMIPVFLLLLGTVVTLFGISGFYIAYPRTESRRA